LEFSSATGSGVGLARSSLAIRVTLRFSSRRVPLVSADSTGGNSKLVGLVGGEAVTVVNRPWAWTKELAVQTDTLVGLMCEEAVTVVNRPCAWNKVPAVDTGTLVIPSAMKAVPVVKRPRVWKKDAAAALRGAALQTKDRTATRARTTVTSNEGRIL